MLACYHVLKMYFLDYKEMRRNQPSKIRVKHGGGPIIVLAKRFTVKGYQTIQEEYLHPMVQTSHPEGGVMYQDDNAPIHTARLVKIPLTTMQDLITTML